MKVGMYYRNDDVRLEEMPTPKIGVGEMLVKMVACGICGSDVMEWYRIKKAPRVLGHEVTGVVVELGEGVKGYNVGDRVFVTHHVPCDECRYCVRGYHSVCDTLRSTNFDPGGFAEYIRVPSINVKKGVYLLPDEVSFEDGTFIEPLGCVVRGQRVARIGKGDTVLVIGSGIAGLLHIQLARIKGAERIIATDINEHRLNAARAFGADVVIDAREDVPKEVCNANNGRLADRVIICTAAISAIGQGLHSVDRGGWILFFAPTEPGIKIPINLFELWNKLVTMTSTYAAVRRDNLEAMELIRSRKIALKKMITHILPLREIKKGFNLVARGGEAIKVIITP
ncbi:alcohol dehydrogenase [candidate division WOR-3 bacterium JGI_Cruoil_03_44_89]|uniref:Alcohol dehydrogenase n=1 Tax=candidate division WOR-3 bacterium JGI_Cruoil_03_44_89 TaxID=1973748 RepID=A0A235BST1_UNCW3|nr:MAG: alcohol dehydrogenase [candidate division WOR-3 bacterium JGI_Cruoil_03_44_89]